ncbi:ABC transporter substrate-binding protein [Aquabacterium sp.]|uniref:ABC transporter substrate-binding protein n=1 Tax=Aquabacterium sp. TaxID=1872578 RepID=UPI002CE0B80C|nr:ABC transporter substrate-binding protein [Aquabacterium sp.]HSW04486.1 ABC transporter substrate-binding protein [Aquabacterium sp.]
MHKSHDSDWQCNACTSTRRLTLRLSVIAASVCSTCLAQGAEPIVLGQTFIGSGPVAAFSAEPVLGIKAMLATVNRAGGIGGRQIVLSQLDDENSPEKAEANVRKLAQQGAIAILMPIGTFPAIGAMKVANELKIPVLGPYTGAEQVYAVGSSVFPMRISFAEEAARIVKHTVLIGQTRMAAVRIDNPGAKLPIDAARRDLQARGSDLIGELVLAQDGSDAEIKARQLAALSPQSIIMSASNLAAGRFIKAYQATGTTSQFYCTSFLNGNQLHKDLGDAAKGVVVMQVVPSPRAAIRLATEFRASMAAIGASTQLSYSSFEGYIAAKALVEALRKAPASLKSPAGIQQALQAMNGHDLGGMTISFQNQARGALNFGELSMIGRNGAFVR